MKKLLKHWLYCHWIDDYDRCRSCTKCIHEKYWIDDGCDHYGNLRGEHED